MGDNIGNIRLTQDAFKEIKILDNLSVVMDGEEAMAFLRREGKYVNAPCPELILLDRITVKRRSRGTCRP